MHEDALTSPLQPDVSLASLALVIFFALCSHVILLAFNTVAVTALGFGLRGGATADSDSDSDQFGRSSDERETFRNSIVRPVILCASQKTLPVALTAVTALAGQMGFLGGIAVVPCVFAHFGQIVFDSFLASFWLKQDAARIEAVPAAGDDVRVLWSVESDSESDAGAGSE